MFKVLAPLALSNLKQNRRLYFPFALAVSIAVSMLYILAAISFDQQIKTIYGGESIQSVLVLGLIILCITGLAIIFYANSFVFKQRTKEYGLYGILGLEKRHLFRLMWIEMTVFCLLSSAIGLGVGLLLKQLILAIFQAILGITVVLSSFYQPTAIIVTVIFACLSYVLLLMVNTWRILHIKPLQLVKEARRGEKKSRFIGLYTLCGIALLGTGYYLALTVDNPVKAIGIFFVAVLAVVIGTQLIFQSGSIVFLNWLKQRKRYYYRSENFISISNLIFRMRKNAVGLASICLLSTMALVTLSTGLSLYIGIDHTISSTYPNQMGFVSASHNQAHELTPEAMSQVLQDFATQSSLTVTSTPTYHYLELEGNATQGAFSLVAAPLETPLNTPHTNMAAYAFTRVQPAAVMKVMDINTYNQITGEQVTLAPQSVLFYSSEASDYSSTLQIGNLSWQVQQALKTQPLKHHILDQSSTIITHQLLIVVNDLAEFRDTLLTHFDATQHHFLTENYELSLNTTASAQTQRDINEAFSDYVLEHLPKSNQTFHPYSREGSRYGLQSLIGSIFFIGILLATIFLIGMSLVIYYKQLSEGLEDSQRFDILMKVGLSKSAIHKTIRKQIAIVFMAPIIVALIHLSGAFHMMSLILRLLGITDIQLVTLVTIGTSLAITLYYFIVFFITSRSYEKIVSKH